MPALPNNALQLTRRRIGVCPPLQPAGGRARGGSGGRPPGVPFSFAGGAQLSARPLGSTPRFLSLPLSLRSTASAAPASHSGWTRSVASGRYRFSSRLVFRRAPRQQTPALREVSSCRGQRRGSQAYAGHRPGCGPGHISPQRRSRPWQEERPRRRRIVRSAVPCGGELQPSSSQRLPVGCPRCLTTRCS